MAKKIPNPWGWSGTIHDFLVLAKAEWLAALQEHHRRCMNAPADPGRLSAWDDESGILTKELKQLLQVKPALGMYTIIFEYKLPRERSRGPDVIILGASVFVLEFRDAEHILLAHVDQVAAYARDLQQHHAGSRQATVVPVLVLARTKELVTRYEDVIVLSPDRIADVFTVESELETGMLIDPVAWMAAGYSP